MVSQNQSAITCCTSVASSVTSLEIFIGMIPLIFAYAKLVLLKFPGITSHSVTGSALQESLYENVQTGDAATC